MQCFVFTVVPHDHPASLIVLFVFGRGRGYLLTKGHFTLHMCSHPCAFPQGMRVMFEAGLVEQTPEAVAQLFLSKHRLDLTSVGDYMGELSVLLLTWLGADSINTG